MTQADLEQLRAVYAEWARGNLGAGGELYAPDVVAEPRVHGRDTVAVGRDAVADYMLEFLAQWRDFRVEAEELVEVGDSVIVTERQHGTGKSSGIGTEMTAYAIWTFFDGLVIRIRWELDRVRALEAARPSEEAMASANLDLARAIYANWDRGDYSSTEWAHPEIEFEIADGLSPGSWRGLDGMAEGFRDILSAWEGFRTVADEFRELDGDRVLAIVHFTGHGKASGLEVGQMGTKGASLFQFGDGRVIRLVIYFNIERAFADLGLAPEA